MKILAVTYCRAMLGANRALLAMIKDMRERYHAEFTVLMPEVKDGDLAAKLEEEGIPYLICPMKMWVVPANVKYRVLRGISAQIKTYALSRHLFQMIKDLSFDLIYSNNSTVQYGAIMAKKRNLPHIWHIREFGQVDYDFEFSYPIKKRVGLFREADRVIAISEAIKKCAEKNICPGAKIERIYDGIEISKHSKEESSKDNILRIVYVAALQPGKCQMDLIRAAEKLIDNGYTGFEIYLIGDGEDYRAELELYVAQHRLSKWIQFMGYREDVKDFLDAMDIGVICSRAEGFGLVTCEYMEASLPVIGADSGATPEIIIDGETGFLYPHGDVNRLSECICEFIKDKTLVYRMGNAGYMRVSKYFNMQKNTDEIYSIFSQLSLSKISS